MRISFPAGILGPMRVRKSFCSWLIMAFAPLPIALGAPDAACSSNKHSVTLACRSIGTPMTDWPATSSGSRPSCLTKAEGPLPQLFSEKFEWSCDRCYICSRGLGEGRCADGTLHDEEIKDIVKDVAVKNHLPIEKEDISTTLAVDSDGLDAIEIVISIAPPIFAEVLGEYTTRTVSEVHQRLAMAGDERLPIVWIGKKHAP
jgi:hypothetical protein